MSKQLSLHTLGELKADIEVPNYDLTTTGCGIVHLGPGAFHRAHQAFYTERALAFGGDWRIHGVSMRSASLKDALAPQDNLYALSIVDDEPKTQVIGAIGQLSTLSRDRERIVEAMVNSATKIISLTVTEKGYCLNSSGHLDTEHPEIISDLQNPEKPVSAIGLIVQTLKLRMQAGYADVTVISCDNVSDNGKKLRQAVTEYAGILSQALEQWITENIAFPCTMVDSITPATDSEFSSYVEQKLGVKDNWPIQREAFTQWVVEDHFSSPRPCWENVGVTFTHDVSFFEKAKLRILNGTHSTLAYVGLLFEKETVFDAISTPFMHQLISRLLSNEIVPSLQGNDDFDINQYAASILKRYENKHIRHMLSQIAWDGSQKIPFRILDTIRDNISANRSIDLLCTAVAAWCVFINERSLRNAPITDPLANELNALAQACEHKVSLLASKLIGIERIFAELVHHQGFQSTVLNKVEVLTACAEQGLSQLDSGKMLAKLAGDQ